MAPSAQRGFRLTAPTLAEACVSPSTAHQNADTGQVLYAVACIAFASHGDALPRQMIWANSTSPEIALKIAVGRAARQLPGTLPSPTVDVAFSGRWMGL